MFRLIAFVFLFMSGISYAEVPTDLFRRDTRGPDIIFNQGFLARGSNTNLIQHVSGVSLHGDRGTVPLSGWVSTSASLRWTTIPRYPITEFWVYTITPDSRAYSVQASFEHYINTNPDSSGAAYVRRLLELYGDQHEWSVLGGIPASSVRFATRYVFTEGEFRADEIRQNPGYRSSIPSANPEPYPLVPASSGEVNAIGSGGAPAASSRWTGLSLSACWGSGSPSRIPRDTQVKPVAPECAIPAESKVIHGIPLRNRVIMPASYFYHHDL